MKYSVETEVNKTLNEVVEKFLGRSSYTFWMDGLLSVEPVSGEQGKEGLNQT